MPPEWGRLEISDLTGVYRNTGFIDKSSESLGLTPYPLYSYFWPIPELDTDAISLKQKDGMVEIQALKRNTAIAFTYYALVSNQFEIKRSGSVNGDLYTANYRFWRNAYGLIAEVDIISAGMFFLPGIGRDRVWIIYHEIK
jgi:hypothetical protein